MSRHNHVKKFTSILLVLLMFTSVFAIKISASDYEDDWSAGVIDYFIKQKVISADSDGNVRPQDAITRAETVALINKAFNFTKTASISYSDVRGSDTFYKDVEIAEAMGYMPNSGASSEFYPNDPLTREEMAIILTRILELLPKPTSANKYSDANLMSDVGKGAIGALTESTVAIADSLGDGEYFYPQDALKRNIAFGLVYKAELYYNDLRAGKKQYSNVNVQADETLGIASGNVKNHHNVTVVGAGSTIENVVIWGNLVIQNSINSGEINVKNVTIKGNVFIYGGSSVKFTDTRINSITVNKANNNISIDILGSSDIDDLIVRSGVDFSAKSKTLSSVTLNSDITKGTDVSVTADTVKDFTVKSPSVNLTIFVAKLGELTMARTSTGSVVDITKGSTVTKATVSSVCTIEGAGTLSSAKVTANGAKILTTGTTVTDPNGIVSKTGAVVSSSSSSSSSTSTTASSSVTYYSNSPTYYSSTYYPYYSSYTSFANWFYSQYGYMPTYDQYYGYYNNYYYNGYYYNGYYYGGTGTLYYNGYYYLSYDEYASQIRYNYGYTPTWSEYYQYIYNNYGFYPSSSYYHSGYYSNTVSNVTDLRNTISYGATYITLSAGSTVYLDSYLSIPSNCTLAIASGTTLYIRSGGTLNVSGAVTGTVVNASGSFTGTGKYNGNYITYTSTSGYVYNETQLINALSTSNGITYIVVDSSISLTNSLSIPSGKIVTINSTLYTPYSLTNYGTIINNGTVYNSSTLYNYGTINNNSGTFYNKSYSGTVSGSGYWTGNSTSSY